MNRYDRIAEVVADEVDAEAGPKVGPPQKVQPVSVGVAANELVKLAKELIGGRKSRKQLYDDLRDIVQSGIALATLPPSYKDLHNEVYGKDARVYFTWASNEDRKKGEEELMARGYRPNSGYSRGSNTSEILVSYFKGWHWDE